MRISWAVAASQKIMYGARDKLITRRLKSGRDRSLLSSVRANACGADVCRSTNTVIPYWRQTFESIFDLLGLIHPHFVKL